MDQLPGGLRVFGCAAIAVADCGEAPAADPCDVDAPVSTCAAPAVPAAHYLEPFDDCGWGDRCDRELTRIVTGRSSEPVSINAGLSVWTTDDRQQVLDQTELDVLIDGDPES